MGGAQLDNLEGSNLQVGCDGDSLTINGKKIVNRKDIVTTNGVIHLIDDVLIPDSAKQVLELAGSQQTTFTDLMAQMGLAAALRPEAEYTLLAPLNDAFTDATLKMDQRLLKIIMQNHVLKSKFLLNELYNGQTLETVGGKLLRVFVYRTAVCIENSCMLRGSKEGRNGAIHSFRKVIRPAEESFYDIIRRDRRFSIFLSLIEHAGLKNLLTEAGAWTLFLPTNDAFDGLSNDDIENLKRDKVALQNILLYHLAPGVFIGDGFEPGVTNILKSLQGNKILITSANNSISVNGVSSPESDLMSNNGVIHVVKKLLFPADLSIGNQQLLTILNKIIKYFTIKFDRSATFKEIPWTKYITKVKVIKEPITTITRVIGGGEAHRTVIQGGTVSEDLGTTVDIISEPSITKITKVIQEPEFKVIQGGETRVTKVIQEPTITKVTRVIEGEPDFKLIKEGETHLTKFIQGEPTITKITRVIEGDQDFKLIKGGETQITKVIQGPEIKYTRVSTGIGGDTDEATLKRMLEEEVTRVSKFIDGDSQLLDDDELKRLLQGGSQISKVTTIVEGEPSETVQISKIVKEPQVQTVRKVQTSRRQQGQPLRRQMRRSHQS